MFKKSRIIAALLCGAMLTACGAQTASPTPTAPAQSSAVTQAPSAQGSDPYAKYANDPSKTYTLEWCINEINAPVDEDAEIKLLLEERYNVKFNVWYVDRTKREELLNIRFAAGDFPDILTTTDAAATANYYSQDLIAELPLDVIEHMMPTIAAANEAIGKTEGISPYVVTTFDGKNYGLPFLNYNGKYQYSSIWRKDWLDSLGITKIPETIEEFETAFYTIRDNKSKLISDGLTAQSPENIYGLSSGRIKEPFASIYGAFGYYPEYWALNGGDLVFGAIQPEMKEALSYLSKWYKDGILNPEFITGENRGDHWSISHDFVEGRIAYTNNGPFYQNMPAKLSALMPKGGRMYRAFVAVNPPEAIADGRPPIGPEGKSGSIVWGQTTGGGILFSKKLEKEPDKFGRLMSIVETLTTTYDGYVLITYGLEGKHWDWEDGVRKSILPESDPVEKYGLNGIFNSWPEALGFSVQDDPKYFEYGDKVANFNSNYSDALHTIRMPSQEIYWDELDKLQKQVYNDIITGKRPIDAFDDFIAEWNRLGGEKITEEANAWYNSVILK